jgi:hypothetical protein
MTKDRLYAIASAQKMLIWSFAALVLLVIPYLFIFVTIFRIISMYRLAKALSKEPILWVLGALIPLVSMILLVRLHSEATTCLRKAGVRVGFMGADLHTIQVQEIFLPSTAEAKIALGKGIWIGGLLLIGILVVFLVLSILGNTQNSAQYGSPQSQAQEWTQFRSDELGFTVLLPGDPTQNLTTLHNVQGLARLD